VCIQDLFVQEETALHTLQ